MIRFGFIFISIKRDKAGYFIAIFPFFSRFAFFQINALPKTTRLKQPSAYSHSAQLLTAEQRKKMINPAGP
jgi:hypothetical protein